MPVLTDSRQKSVTIATSLERWRKEGQLIIPTYICTYPENLAKIRALHSEKMRLQGDR